MNGRLLLQGDLLDANCADLLRFAFLATQTRGKYQDCFLHKLLRQLNLVMSRGFELFVVLMYLPLHGHRQPLRELRCQVRRARQDPQHLAHIAEVSRNLHGSSRVAVAALTGNPSLDARMTHCHNHIFFGKVQNVCRGTGVVSLAFDPGSYAGESTCCGVGYSADTGQAWVLPLKAASTKIRGFARRAPTAPGDLVKIGPQQPSHKH